MTSKQFLKSLSNIEKQLANINKAMGAATTKKTTKTKDNGIKKLIKSIEKCDKKSDLKKFTVAQLTGFLEHKGIKIRKSVKNDLIDAVWDSLDESGDSDSSDSESDSSDSDSDSSDSD
jgi:hypothetical protein